MATPFFPSLCFFASRDAHWTEFRLQMTDAMNLSLRLQSRAGAMISGINIILKEHASKMAWVRYQRQQEYEHNQHMISVVLVI
ncbi:Hypothetical protein, putative [Bodo saltans]|uniref:Uncharacterized protein n=1 Tax=Bodo saltans TaxID=75058 RepID=A0A0S4JY27_BODSA|nr:Hypothetical protein, putative [Bodo saltans]|eukprot:CUG94045.1 Hypothetical protein, putative [Bodo saltans]